MSQEPKNDLFGDLLPLAKGDTVQRGDVFVDDGQRFEMSRSGVLLGCYCLGKTIIKDNGGWHRPSPKTKDQAHPTAIRAVACISFVLLLAACDRPMPAPTKFRAGDIVRVKLTSERLAVVGLTNRPFVSDERYDVRNHEGYIREMWPHELERDE